MTDKEVMQMALDALLLTVEEMRSLNGSAVQQENAIEALRAALAQPEPEPVAWGIRNSRPTEKQLLTMAMLYEPPYSPLVVPLYTAPPQREWAGLTDEERVQCELGAKNNYVEFARAIEAKLKEKNT